MAERKTGQKRSDHSVMLDVLNSNPLTFLNGGFYTAALAEKRNVKAMPNMFVWWHNYVCLVGSRGNKRETIKRIPSAFCSLISLPCIPSFQLCRVLSLISLQIPFPSNSPNRLRLTSLLLSLHLAVPSRDEKRRYTEPF